MKLEDIITRYVLQILVHIKT